MTKKVSKKNLICLFPPRSGKENEKVDSKHALRLPSNKCEIHMPDENADWRMPAENADWQTLYDYLETSPWGPGLFGAPMDDKIRAILLRSIELAFKSEDKVKIAKSYRQLFYFCSEFNHPDTLEIGLSSVDLAVEAYGSLSAEVAEELAMVAVAYESRSEFEKALETRDASIKIFQNAGTDERLFEALEMAICSALDRGLGDKVEEYAKLGIQIVSERCKKGSAEYSENMEYFQEMLETAHEPPIPIEEKRNQLLAIFPALTKVIQGTGKK